MSILRSPAQLSPLSLCIFAALGVIAPVASQADPSTVTDTVTEGATTPTVTLDDIVITATRSPNKISNTIAQTKVINADELKRYQGQTVLDVLKRQPGFSFKQDGGIGASGNFYLRGFDSKRVLVLIDGIRYGSMSAGQPALNLLPADQLDRIEILYGASGSSLYGSDAMGGVIQLFTKGNHATQDQFSITAGVGSHNHTIYGASAQMVNDQGAKLSLSASRNQTDGFSALEHKTGNNRDDDGFKSNNFAVNANIPLTDTFSVGGSGLFAKSTTEFDDYNNSDNAEIDQKNGAVSVFSQYANDDFSLRLSAGKSLDKLDNKVGDEYETKQKQANLLGIYHLPKGQFQAGAEWLKQNVDVNDNTPDNGTDGYKINERTIKSGFLGYQLNHDNYDLQANVRYDDNSQFDNETTYGLGFAAKLAPSLRIGTSFATGYRAPSLNDLYIESAYYLPNEDLEVEKSNNLEVFIESNTDMQTTRLTGFNSRVSNLINNVYDPKTYKYQATNIDNAQLSGYSLTSDWQINNYLFGGHYTYTHAMNRSGANKGKHLVYRPEHTGLAYVGYQALDFDVRAEAEFSGDRYSAHDNSTSIDGYTLYNLSGNYYLNPNLTLSSRINNITNKDYTTNEGYGDRYQQDGINFLASATYTWF